MTSDKLKRLGVEIFAVGITEGGARSQLGELVSEPVANHVFTLSYRELKLLSSSLKNKICDGKPVRALFSSLLTRELSSFYFKFFL